jgi:RHS repeat-associated protein
VNWVHQDPVNKSQRLTDAAGTWFSAIELDSWGANTNRSINSAFQPRTFTSYERDGNGSDEAMHRRYNRWHSRFDQPDPYDGSYSLADPQSFNRYAYVQNDPVNFVDPSGLLPCADAWCGSGGFGGWGGGYSGGTGWSSQPRPGLASIEGTSFTSSVYEPDSNRIRFWAWAPYPELLDQVIANTWSGFGGQGAFNESQVKTIKEATQIAENKLENRNCARYILGGRRANIKSLFRRALATMTMDYSLDGRAETDPGRDGRIRLGQGFFDLSSGPISLIAEIEWAVGKDLTKQFAQGVDQRAYVLLHEFRHSVTGREHKTQAEYKNWLKGLYDNCY